MPFELALELELDPPVVDVDGAAGVVEEAAGAGVLAEVEEELDGLPPQAAIPRAAATTAAATSFRPPWNMVKCLR